MHFSIEILNPSWELICKVERGTKLAKGKNDQSQRILHTAAKITQRFGCYSWATDTAIMYCGSFSRDYSGKQFRTNLEGRVYQYLNNHKRDSNGMPKNTNAEIFDQINQTCVDSDLFLRILQFDRLCLGHESIDYLSYSLEPYLVHAVEKLVISTYHHQSQCSWNKE